MRGLPRLCVGLHNLGWALISSTHMLASTHIRESRKTWKWSLPSTHMRAILRICVALECASKDGVTFSFFQTCGSCVIVCCQGAFHAYVWIFYACAWMTEACGSLGHVWACLDVTLERELLASHAYAWDSTPMRGSDEVSCHA
ncbi:hypothetical protein PIB30_067571 [Stylosanthes scabra]|uniref:Secreted protein n=1 Tax=Stylosanthes scabra TaxID=79078 RepID=A0ABU6XNY9_9FABA|nr:hypothetical protein [Stylosanthes scabra]